MVVYVCIVYGLAVYFCVLVVYYNWEGIGVLVICYISCCICDCSGVVGEKVFVLMVICLSDYWVVISDCRIRELYVDVFCISCYIVGDCIWVVNNWWFLVFYGNIISIIGEVVFIIFCCIGDCCDIFW